MVARANKSQSAQERDQLIRRTLVDTLTFSERVQMVKHFEEPSAWLMDRADYGSSLACQKFQQADTLETRRAVQTTAKEKLHTI